MSRYVITQEQLDYLQQQLQKISHLTDVKEERIKELEAHKIRVSEPETATLVKTIGKLENEVSELKKINAKLVSKIESLNKSKEEQIRDLQLLLDEERKLREYSEAFAKQMELKCAEEVLIRELTNELCQLQKNEIEIDNKKISELQNKVKKMSEEFYESQTKRENKKNSNKNSKESDTSKQLKAITQKLHLQLISLYDDSAKTSKSRDESERDENVKRELQKWMKEMSNVMENVDDIQKMKTTLNYMKEEIENRRKANSHKKKSNLA